MRRLRAITPALLAFAVAAGLGFAAPAASAAPVDADAEARAIAEARTWQGRWCPPTGCRTEPASLASFGGFAAVTLGVLALARRRPR